MSMPLNSRLLHQMQGNNQLAQYVLCRFQENYPVLLQLFSQAWGRGDASSVHAIGARIASHLRVIGLSDELASLERLLNQTALGSTLSQDPDWACIQYEAVRGLD